MASSSESTQESQGSQDSQDDYFYSSFVVEYIVPYGKEQEATFRRWYDRLVQAARQFEGYTRNDLCPPLDCGDGVVKWYSIVHFRTPDDLNYWLKSSDRAGLLEEGRDAFLAYRYKSFTTGLEGWFSTHTGGAEQHNLGPPPWKQVLAVVLGLYPTIMIQSMVFGALGIMQSWPMAASLVINNLVTSSILTWLVMPRISRMLSFWLRPAYRLTALQTNLIGAGLVFAGLGLMVSVFTYLT
jgi:antibiotic biosynthesis monooxygenase (ABM) superfamily enzyme